MFARYMLTRYWTELYSKPVWFQSNNQRNQTIIVFSRGTDWFATNDQSCNKMILLTNRTQIKWNNKKHKMGKEKKTPKINLKHFL